MMRWLAAIGFGATVTLCPAARIVTHPASTEQVVDGRVSFRVSLKDVSGVVSYQWFKDNDLIAGATSSSYNLSRAATGDAGVYHVTVADSLSTLTSLPASLTILPLPAPRITSYPGDVAGLPGEKIFLHASANMGGRLTYTWFRNDTQISSGISNSPLVINSLSVLDVGTYRVEISNDSGTAVSDSFEVSLLPAAPLRFTRQPAAIIDLVGGELFPGFGFETAGATYGAYTYYKNGERVPGLSGPNALAGLNATADLAGTYTIEFTDYVRTVTSSPCQVRVNSPLVGFLIKNLSGGGLIAGGSQTTLTVAARPGRAVTFQWYRNGEPLPGAVSPVLHFPVFGHADRGSYTVELTNAFTVERSPAITLELESLDEPPVITRALPARQSQLVLLQPEVRGEAPFYYQWRRDGADIPQAANSNYAVDQPGTYTVLITNRVGSVETDPVEVFETDGDPPAIVIQPAPYTVLDATDNISPNVTLRDYTGASYQWQKDGVDLPNATGQYLRLSPAHHTDAGDYRVVITNAAGSVTSGTSTLTVATIPGRVVFTAQPQIQRVDPGATVTVSATVSSPDDQPSYQWTKNGQAIPGATAASLTIANFSPDDTGSYALEATNSQGTVRSRSGYLAHYPTSATTGITFVQQPASQIVRLGEPVTFSVDVTSDEPVTYQWLQNMQPIGSDSPTLHLEAVDVADGGYFAVRVSNTRGTLTSEPGYLDVQSPVQHHFVSSPTNQTTSAGDVLELHADFATRASNGVGYQWYLNGTALPGANSTTLTLDPVRSTDSGSYQLIATDLFGALATAPAFITVLPPGQSEQFQQHAIGWRYWPGQPLTLQQTVAYTGTLDRLDWQVLLPEHTTLISLAGLPADTTPSLGETSLAEWSWDHVPPSPFTFSYTVQVDTGTEDVLVFTSHVVLQRGDTSKTVLAQPDPLIVALKTAVHSADANMDGSISLEELLAVIALYNARDGSRRTGAYVLDASGFRPTAGAGQRPRVPHSADANSDGAIDLTELLRIIELYNYRIGTNRTGNYSPSPATEDGFAPGPILLNF